MGSSAGIYHPRLTVRRNKGIREEDVAELATGRWSSCSYSSRLKHGEANSGAGAARQSEQRRGQVAGTRAARASAPGLREQGYRNQGGGSNSAGAARATSSELREGMCRLAARGPRSRAEVRQQRVGLVAGQMRGKEALLNALSALCTSCHETISALNPDAPSAILSLVSSACTKKAQKYREAAFCCLEQVIETFNNPEFFNMVFPSLLEMGKSLAPTKSGQISSASNDKAVKMSVFSSTKELCSKLHSSANNLQESSTHTSITAFVHELFYTLTPELLKSLRTVKIGQVHIAAAECLLALTNQYTAPPPAQWTELSFMTELLDLCEVEKSEQAKSLLKKSYDILHRLKEDIKP
ncbi:UNVERIFIED_CONTAM: hypothetical protein Sangu_0422100 [Sesamum angustifolium]|uniref:Uncharacterized protein n=1 Tax=Sesamum angustifolium TaxID=2727405 RepID=A0AAW2QTA7_9LAMI